MEELSYSNAYSDSLENDKSVDTVIDKLQELKLGCNHDHRTKFDQISSCHGLNKLSTRDSGYENIENENPVVQSDKEGKSIRKPVITSNVAFPGNIKISKPISRRLSAELYDKNATDDEKDRSEHEVPPDIGTPKLTRLGFKKCTSPKSYANKFPTTCTYTTHFSGKEIRLESINDHSPQMSASENRAFDNSHSDYTRMLFKRLSHQFTASPKRFTQRLRTVLEESLSHAESDNVDTDDVSLRRLTQEFRKICDEYRIEDESMPDYNSICMNETHEQSKRPLRALNTIYEKVGTPKNDTASFIYWEDVCNSENSSPLREKSEIDSPLFRECPAQQTPHSYQSSPFESEIVNPKKSLLKFIDELRKSSEVLPASPAENRSGFLNTLNVLSKYLSDDQQYNRKKLLDCILECSEDTSSKDSENMRTNSPIFDESPAAKLETGNSRIVSKIEQPNDEEYSPVSVIRSPNREIRRENNRFGHHSTPNLSKKVPTVERRGAAHQSYSPKTIRTPDFRPSPRIITRKPSPSVESKGNGWPVTRANKDSPEHGRTSDKINEYKPRSKYFFTPGRTPPPRENPGKKRFFGDPTEKSAGKSPGQKKTNLNSLLPYKLNYNAVESPVASYIRGTDVKLIKNVIAKTNDRLLTPKKMQPATTSRAISPILTPSQQKSAVMKESVGLKFKLSPPKASKHVRKNDILNTAMCESDTSCVQSKHEPNFPRVMYKQPAYRKMVVLDSPQSGSSGSRHLLRTQKEEMIYRHEGRLKSSIKYKSPRNPVDTSFNESISGDSADISVVHQIRVGKSNYLP